MFCGSFDDVISRSNRPILWLKIIIRVFRTLDLLSSVSGSKIMQIIQMFQEFPKECWEFPGELPD